MHWWLEAWLHLQESPPHPPPPHPPTTPATTTGSLTALQHHCSRLENLEHFAAGGTRQQASGRQESDTSARLQTKQPTVLCRAAN